ncbi:putative 36.0 kDa protein C45G9.5 in chromosome III [Ditylenchus destructor]|nr:putative 36.0 kDa protein C45G9.5 in chromosome III [Ditylenchus destructor]
MTEKPSNTANHQRLKEMMCHLTPKGAVIPYNICYDSNDELWVASKGGLFKMDDDASKVLFESKNEFPKKIAPYTQVIHHNGKIIHVFTEDKAALTQFRILDLNGKIEHEQFIDGKIQSLAVNAEGDIFMTKQPMAGQDESMIYKSSIDCPLGWDELCSSFDFAFQAICVYDENTIAVATTSLPINICSKQSIKWIDTNSGDITGTFSKAGKEDGEIYFPRCMQRYEDDIVVMDKTGRLQRFHRSGDFHQVAAKIDAYIGNGFVVRGDKAILVCSGIVVDKDNESLCDDWIEAIHLDGSCWTKN